MNRLRTTMLGWAGLVCLALPLAATLGCGSGGTPVVAADPKVVQQLRAGGEVAATDEPAAEDSQGEGWASLTGRFLFEGALPPLAPFPTGGKDAGTCGAQVQNTSLLVDGDTQGVANIVLFARDAKRIFEEEQPAAAATPFDQKGCLFLSRVYPVRVGVPVTILNSDPIAHNTSLSPQGNDPFNQLLPMRGDEATYTFRKEISEPVAVSCSIHPWMKAYMIARNNPYVAVTQADGSFRIDNLPAGVPLTFQCWHELAGGSGGPFAAQPDWSKGRFKLTLTQDETYDLGTITINAASFQ